MGHIHEKQEPTGQQSTTTSSATTATAAASSLPLVLPTIERAKHVKYWRRCVKASLPHYYTSNDSNRMSLAFFIVAALDLLDGLDEATTAEERQGYIEWVYHCQHPEGGFRAFPGSDFAEKRDDANKCWDPANLPATYFAIAILILLGDDLERLKRWELLAWLPSLQREDGSFGESLVNGAIEGGRDSRFGYLAAQVRWMLRGAVEGPVDGIPDIDIDQLVKCINSAETYDGGIADEPFHEAHAGFTYCALGALWFLNRLPGEALPDTHPLKHDKSRITGLTNMSATLHWLIERQTTWIIDHDDDGSSETSSNSSPEPHIGTHEHEQSHGGDVPTVTPPIPESDDAPIPVIKPALIEQTPWTGLNGRCNKMADTCYSWWVCGSLAMLRRLDLVETTTVRGYLIDKTQHLIGGFGKTPGAPPDVYHSYLGLATLGLWKDDPCIRAVDPATCWSANARKRLEGMAWRVRMQEHRTV